MVDGKVRGLGRFFALSSLWIGAMALSGCGIESETFRYRLTVEVETPQGLRTGSSVLEVKVEEQMTEQIIGNKVRGRLRGEAVAVDLPGGRTLYALLRDERQVDAGKWYAHRAISTPPPGKGHHFLGVKRARWMEDNKAKGDLRRERYPMLVTFTDESDPTSVKLVGRDDLAAAFGEDYALRRVWVEITDDPVTTGIEVRLAWLEQVGRERGTLIPDPPELLKDAHPIDLVGPGEFSTELFK